MQLLLVALCVLAIGGLLALVTSGNAKLARLCGSLGAMVGCALGLAGVLSILLGGQQTSIHLAWDVPYGSFWLETDPLSAFFCFPVLVLSGLAAFFAGGDEDTARGRPASGGLWFFFNLLVASMLVVALARNGVLFLVAWEVMSLAAFFLITTHDTSEEVRDAGRTFLVATHLGTAFLLVMFVLLASGGGSLDFDALSVGAGGVSAGLVFCLAVVGFGTKAGLMPFHVWLPESYPVAPSYVSAVMSGAMSKLGIYGLLRIVTLLPEIEPWFGWLLIALGVVSALLGILWALGQQDLKRLLAYSSIENMGIITMGVGLGLIGLATDSPLLSLLGFTGAVFHVLNHALYKGLLFLGADAVSRATGTQQIDELGGLLKRMPWTGSAFLIGAVAIAGLPPLNGFASEFLLYSASFGTEGILAVSPRSIYALAVIATLALVGGLAAFCFAKLFGIVFLGTPRTPRAVDVRPTTFRTALPIVLLAGGCIAVGLLSRQVVSALLPVVGQLTHQGAAQLTAQADIPLEPLARVAQVSLGLFVLMGVLAAIRRVLLSNREVAVSGTWGCGFSAPTPRIQYTASSFAHPAIEFFTPLIRWRRHLVPPTGLFPQSASLTTESSDVYREFLYRPVFDSIGRTLSKLRWLQQGRVHVYVLYVGCTIVALLVWYASFEIPPSAPPATEHVGETSPRVGAAPL